MTAAAQHKSTMRINEDIVIEETRQAGMFRRRHLDITEKWMVDGVIEPVLHKAAVSFGLWFDQAQLRDCYSSLGLDRVDGSRSDEGLQRGIQARKEISIAMNLLGDSMGPVVWT